MPPTPDDPLQSPQDSDSDVSASKRITNPNTRQSHIRPSKSPLTSVASLSYRRSNASLSQLFQSTSSPPQSQSRAGTASGTVTPSAGGIDDSVFSPSGSTRVNTPASTTIVGQQLYGETRDLILKAFAPHVSVLASQDTEELIRHKGINGGLLELLRAFGERVQGRVTIRDSTGASRSWDDFAIRFIGVKDGLDPPRASDRRSTDSVASQARNGHQRMTSLEFKPARLRTGGDVPQIEELVERHLTFAEEQTGRIVADYISYKDTPASQDPSSNSPFYMLYLRRLLSGMPMVPSEALSHPVAIVIAISSRSASPIEELRTLFASSNTGEHRLPPWVLNEFLRYYVLIHDEDFDDIQKSMALFDQMKRHFGLHCHLLRLRSTQCVPSDDDSLKLPRCEWVSAAEELAEITRRELNDEDEDPTPFIFESDATAVRGFVREMVTQSIIPSMERASATWNDQVASRRRGISGRFMSLSKRFTTFGGRSPSQAVGGAGTNYDSVQGFYRPDTPEAIMRRLADYSLMLRDFRLAQSTFEILCQDYKNDKAWRYYAGANEMAATSALLALSAGVSNKVRAEAIDQYLESAHYSYITRVGSPYNALRTLLLSVELLKPRNGTALDDAARWLTQILDDRLVGPIGHALILERVAQCYSERKGVPALNSGERKRKAAFWYTLAGDAWLRLEQTNQAEKCISEAMRLYQLQPGKMEFHGMHHFLMAQQNAVKANRAGPQPFDGAETGLQFEEQMLVEPLQDVNESLAPRSPRVGHRKSLSMASARLTGMEMNFDPLGAGEGEGTKQQTIGTRLDMETERRDDGFE